MPGIKIDNRLAIPVRLIPLTTGWKWSPDKVACILSDQDEIYGITINSYHLTQDGQYHRMLPKEWDVIRTDLQILSDSLKSGESIDNDSYPDWRYQSLGILPPATFVWLEDLERNASSAFSQYRYLITDERPGDRKLNLDPYILPSLISKIYEGFEHLMINSIHEINKIVSGDQDTSSTYKPSSTGTVSSKTLTQNCFVLTGDHWTVTFGSKTATFKNTLGMRYLEYLIRNQGKEIPVIELSNAINPPEYGAHSKTLSTMSLDALDNIGLRVGAPIDACEILDSAGIQNIKNHLERLSDRIEVAKDTGDEATQAQLEEEKKQIQQQLVRDIGLGGKSRSLPSQVEQTRKNVTKCIRQVLNKIRDSFPELGHHLNCVKTGTFCQYAPAPKTEWNFDKT